MIRDRGNIKWRGMMLTEHVKDLKLWLENDKKTEKPQFDDFELEIISDEIIRAKQSKSGVKLTYWRDGYLNEDYGHIIEINRTNHTLILDSPFSTTRYAFDEITAVQIIE